MHHWHLPFRIDYKRLVWAVLLGSGGLYLLYLLRDVHWAFVLGIVLAYLFDPPVSYLETRGWSRGWAIIFVYAVTLLGLGLVIAFVFPGLQRQVNVLIHDAPRYLQEVEELINKFYYNYQEAGLPVQLEQAINSALDQVEALLVDFTYRTAQGIVGFLPQTLNLILAPVVGFYLLRDKEILAARAGELLPARWREELISLWGQVNAVVAGFIQGRLLVAALVGLMTGIGLAVIGMDFALLLGVFAGLADVIPYFGPLIGAIPAVVLAFFYSPYMVLYVVLVVLVVQQIESNLISPKILGESVGLHPLLVIVALLAGARLWGAVGLLVAVPLAGILRILLGYAFTKLS